MNSVRISKFIILKGFRCVVTGSGPICGDQEKQLQIPGEEKASNPDDPSNTGPDSRHAEAPFILMPFQ